MANEPKKILFLLSVSELIKRVHGFLVLSQSINDLTHMSVRLSWSTRALQYLLGTQYAPPTYCHIINIEELRWRNHTMNELFCATDTHKHFWYAVLLHLYVRLVFGEEHFTVLASIRVGVWRSFLSEKTVLLKLFIFYFIFSTQFNRSFCYILCT